LRAARLPCLGECHNSKEQPLFLPSKLKPSSPALLEDYPVARRDLTNHPVENDYLDRKDKTAYSNHAHYWNKANEQCGNWSVVGQCQKMHRFAKKLNCGREWCELCREEMEARRVARWLPKLRQMSSMGYWVITIPRELSPLLRTNKSRRIFARKVRRAFKKLGYLRGLTRWHFFGDKNNDFFPHLNVLVDGEWLEPEQLEWLKAELRRTIFSKYLRQRYNDNLDIHYEYRDTPGKVMHTLKYVCRATFLNKSWDETLARNLYNFRNCGWWGHWDQDPKWDAPTDQDHAAELIDLANGICPICKTEITWNRKPTTTTHVLMQGATPLCGGFFCLPTIRPPPKTRARPRAFGTLKGSRTAQASGKTS